VNDQLDAEVLTRLAAEGTRLIALRSAGYNNVDLPAASRLALTVTRVPGYSPHAVAEHTIALILALNRKVHRAWARIREGNFSLDGLLGFDLVGRTAGVVGTGKIGVAVDGSSPGSAVACWPSIPCPVRVPGAGTSYVPLPDLLAASDIVSLHCPLTRRRATPGRRRPRAHEARPC